MNQSDYVIETKKPTILLVEDVPENIAIAIEAFKGAYRVITALDGERALAIATGAARKPDLILLDVQMPGIDGYEVCRRLKANPATREIPVIFLTSLGEQLDEARGFSVGAVDYIHKPFSPGIAQARVATHLSLKDAHNQLANQNMILEKTVRERTDEISRVQSVTIHAMAALAEARDNETGNHIIRTQRYVERLAWRLSDHPLFIDQLTSQVIEWLYKSAPLHDIGKVGVPDRILLKPGKLDSEEFEVMKTHTLIGAEAIAKAEESLASGGTSFLSCAREIVLYHHERWDGKGYPQGLCGNAIPVSARIMAIADVYDALISRRVYKPPFTPDQAEKIIGEGRGLHFDPEMVDAFFALRHDFRNIAQEFRDEQR